MPQKVVQNDGLALLLKTMCHTSPKKILSLRKNPICAPKPRILTLSGYGCPIYGYAVAYPTHHLHRPASNRQTTDNGAPGPPTLPLIPLRQKPLGLVRRPLLRRNPQSEPPTFSPPRHPSPVAQNHSFCSPGSQEASCSREGTPRQAPTIAFVGAPPRSIAAPDFSSSAATARGIATAEEPALCGPASERGHPQRRRRRSALRASQRTRLLGTAEPALPGDDAAPAVTMRYTIDEAPGFFKGGGFYWILFVSQMFIAMPHVLS